MRRIETYELIERYLLGRTSADENAAIELRMKNDPSFAVEVEEHRGMQQVIQEHSILDVREILTGIRKQKQISIQRRNKLYRSMLIVGSCAIIVSLSLLFILNNNDGAVRRASEAQRASEAFTDSLAPETGSDTMAADTAILQESLQKEKIMQTPKKPDLPEGKAVSGKQDAGKNIQADTSAHKPFPYFQSVKDSAPADIRHVITPDSTSADLQHMVTPDLHSALSPCKIKAEYTIEPSCNNRATGVIEIIESTISDGTPPYQAMLNGERGDSMVFRGLKPGFYKLEIKDASGCLVSLGSIVVDTKDCSYQGNFYPLYEQWEMPLDSRPGTIEIFDKNGRKVYELRFDASGKEYWNGNDMNNEALPMGLYLFTITYDNGDVFPGSVTINR